jgi:hypothetical protein
VKTACMLQSLSAFALLSTADLNGHFETYYGIRHLQFGLTSRMKRYYSRLSIYRSSRNDAETKA